MSPQPKEKTLILIRHAERDTRNKKLDNGLNEHGQKQALRVKSEFHRLYLFSKATFISSPLKRCVETLEPVAQSYESSIILDPRLQEQLESETFSDMLNRIRQFTTEWHKDSNETTILCSHGDVLPLIVEDLLNVKVEFDKGGWSEIVSFGKIMFLKFRN